jgi:excisionase family DNA binding protein
MTIADLDSTAPLLLDSRQVAQLLGLGRTKVFQMMAGSQLPTVRVGRCVRVPREALDEWIRGQTKPALDSDDCGRPAGW